MTRQGIGASALRKEDRRFLTGRGSYVADRIAPGTLWCAFVRSPHAHARIAFADTARARALPGVAAVLTGADMAADGVGPLPLYWDIRNDDGSRLHRPDMYALARDVVRFVGQPCAMAVAASAAAARDAAECVDIRYESLPAAATLAEATAPGAPAVWPDCPGNVALHWRTGCREAVDAAFSGAARVVSLDLVNQRVAAVPIETRACRASRDAGSGRFTLETTCQLPHEMRRLLAQVFAMPETDIDVVAPDIGGSFGMKSYAYPEDIAVFWAGRRLERPVAWTCDRSEAFQCDAGGRDHIARGELALDAEHRFLALRVSLAANMGAYLSQHAPAVPTIYLQGALPGPYRIGAVALDVRCVFTHSAPVDAYRGAGRSEAVHVTERLIDHAAREIGIDCAELRAGNLLASEELPWKTALGAVLDSGDAPALLRRALERGDRAGFAARRGDARARGRLRGQGLAIHAANCGGCPSAQARAAGALTGSWESARLRIHRCGSATLHVGAHNHGQGHETVFSQLVAEKTGIPSGSIDVVFGDTRRVQHGIGTFASRSLVICGPAVALACDRVIGRASRVAAHLLQAEADDVEFRDGRFRVAGTGRAVPFADVAHAAHSEAKFGEEGGAGGLDETACYDPEDFTWPFGAHLAEVEIDPGTGAVELVRYVAIDDIGVEINPLVVEGQIHGGVAQGIGQALMEQAIYEPGSGRLATPSLMDYAVPRADTLCPLISERIASRCSTNPLGAKGVGEVGTFAAPAAVTNAVCDALACAGVASFDMPATPERIWRALNGR